MTTFNCQSDEDIIMGISERLDGVKYQTYQNNLFMNVADFKLTHEVISNEFREVSLSYARYMDGTMNNGKEFYKTQKRIYDKFSQVNEQLNTNKETIEYLINLYGQITISKNIVNLETLQLKLVHGAVSFKQLIGLISEWSDCVTSIKRH